MLNRWTESRSPLTREWLTCFHGGILQSSGHSQCSLTYSGEQLPELRGSSHHTCPPEVALASLSKNRKAGPLCGRPRVSKSLSRSHSPQPLMLSKSRRPLAVRPLSFPWVPRVPTSPIQGSARETVSASRKELQTQTWPKNNHTSF